MKNIIQTAKQLLGRKLTANDGYTSDEIKQAENMLGLTMPESLKLFYSLVGKVDVLTSSFQRFLPLDELQSDGDKIIFLADKMKDINETHSRFEQMRSMPNVRKYRYCFFDYMYYRLYVDIQLSNRR